MQSIHADRGLRAEFMWRGDRFYHSIYGVKGNKKQLLLTSVEGGLEDVWPPSPPYQEFNDPRIVSDTQHGSVGLAVGAAGKSFWSLGIEVVETGNPALVFDIACRVKEPPQWLGSTYEFQNVDALRCGFQQVEVQDGKVHYVLKASEAISASAFHVTDKQVAISYPNPSDLSPPMTCRWGYRIELLEDVTFGEKMWHKLGF